MTEKQQEKLKKLLSLMQQDLEFYEAKYDGKFAEEPYIGFGNRKTRCCNEYTLPIITCSKSCLTRCVNTCYVIWITTYPRKQSRRCQARNTVLRRIDPMAYYEHFFRVAESKKLPIRLSDGGDFENAQQAQACIAAARAHPSVQAIGYTKRIELLKEFLDSPANLHMRYSAWEGDEKNMELAKSLGFDVTHVVYGSGNCPYQKSLELFKARKKEIAKTLRAQGFDTKTANKMAEKEADAQIKIHHCANCAEKLIGCCAKGTIRFNVVK